MRKLASQVPEAVSRLQRAGVSAAVPTWYIPVLSNPPPIQPARSTVARSRRLPSSSHTKEEALYNDLFPRKWDASAEGTTKSHKMKHYREKKPKPQAIVYEEDRIRRQFFKDFPYEALRPVSLVEGLEVMEEGLVKGEAWTELVQRGMYPTVEDTIAFVLNLHHTHNQTLSDAYHQATYEFGALRARHEQSTIAAEVEAQAYGAQFKPSQFERTHNKEQSALATLASHYSSSAAAASAAAAANANTSGSVPSNKYRKPTRWTSEVNPTGSGGSGVSGGFENDLLSTGGQAGMAYVKGWTMPPPLAASTWAHAQVDGQGQAHGDGEVQSGQEDGNALGEMQEPRTVREQRAADEAILRAYV